MNIRIMNIRIHLPIKSTISAHRNINGLLEDLVSKDYIDGVYKAAFLFIYSRLSNFSAILRL
jgi:hypothetical protein